MGPGRKSSRVIVHATSLVWVQAHPQMRHRLHLHFLHTSLQAEAGCSQHSVLADPSPLGQPGFTHSCPRETLRTPCLDRFGFL